MSASNSSRGHLVRRGAGFTLVEMLVVMAIILLMVGLGVSAFKGGAATDGVKAASGVAAGEFDLARNEAIMRQTLARVIIDTAYDPSRTDLADHYLRRMTVAYLNPLGVDAGKIPVTTSGLPVDPFNKNNWIQSGAWTVLPGNVYFDIKFTVFYRTNMDVTFGWSSNSTGGYSYYEFGPSGQTPAGPYSIFTPSTASASDGSVNNLLAQCVLSTGIVNATTGSFQEKGSAGATPSATAPKTCYGFVLYRMGHLTFFRDNSEIQQPTS